MNLAALNIHLLSSNDGPGPVLIFLMIAGGLAFFIYGMKVMSEGIQKVAGSRLREILKAMTSNRLAGVGTGFLTTSIIQSSSATTVMVVSFVNAGLLSLRQSIGVIMGANIGTTMTAWILVFVGFKFSLADYALPLMAFSVPLLFVSKSKLRNLGEFVLGFALLFIGLEALKDSVALLDLKHNTTLINWVSDMGQYGFFSTLFFIFIGTVLTVIVQSSSAAMALTLTFMDEGGITYAAAAAIILGENIGTTITANIAALVGNVHAKRAARAHLIFNIFGVLWMLLIFNSFTGWIEDLFIYIQKQPWGTAFSGAESTDKYKYALALFHTCFNIINTLLLVWFVIYIEKIVIKLVKRKDDDESFSLEFIGNGTFRTPELSLLEAKKEIAKFGKITSRLSGFVQNLMVEHNAKERIRLLKKIKHYEEITDRVEIEVANYLSKVSEGNLTKDSSVKVRGMLSIVNDLERIGDIFYQMSLILEKKNTEKIYFTPEQRDNIKGMFLLLDKAFVTMRSNLSSDEQEAVNLTAASDIEDEINNYRNKLRTEHLVNMEAGVYSHNNGVVYSELFSLCERVGDHIINVSEGASGLV